MKKNKDIAALVAAEATHADATKDDPYPEGAVFERRNALRSTVYSVRLSAEEVNAVQREAAAAHIPAATLVRSWIKERLSGSTTSTNEERLRSLIHDEVQTAVYEALHAH